MNKGLMCVTQVEKCVFRYGEVIYRPLLKKKKKKKERLAGGGCSAIQPCAPLTDWNIPHRQRIGLSSAGQLSLCSRKKTNPIFF